MYICDSVDIPEQGLLREITKLVSVLYLFSWVKKEGPAVKQWGLFMLSKEEYLAVVTASRKKFSLDSVTPRGRKRSLYYSLFIGAAMNIGRHYTDVEDVYYCCEKKGKTVTKRRTRIITLGGIGKICGALNHSTVKHHFNNHNENMKLSAYHEFYEHMNTLAQEVISSRQPAL